MREETAREIRGRVAGGGEVPQRDSGVVEEERFQKLLNRRCGELLSISRFVAAHAGSEVCFTRPLLGDLLSEATKVEEILDAYGARNNRRWGSFRRLVAPLKLFSEVAYLLLHIRLFLPVYRLLPIEEDFAQATDQALHATCGFLRRFVGPLVRRAEALGVSVPEGVPELDSYVEFLPPGHLKHDRHSRKSVSPEETVVYLATAFLNLAEEAKFLHLDLDSLDGRYSDLIPDPVSEEGLRNMGEKFHSLQSLYDTYISESNVESLDQDLLVLRGHITVIYHLLETATALAHYYERHMVNGSGRPAAGSGVEPDALLGLLFGYSIDFASRYIVRTRGLCHRMLKRYAIQGRITVPVPRYRGFHVRPSTLVAKIVNHYGSEAEMHLEEEVYDAGVTLDLFRANEKLNARKRRVIAEEVGRLFRDGSTEEGGDPRQTLRGVVHLLFERGTLVLYERHLAVEDLAPAPDESADQFVIRALVRLLTLGKIDLQVDSSVTFVGDRRVLEDIKLLAEHGYGEDDFGNNLPLPAKLSYLRRP